MPRTYSKSEWVTSFIIGAAVCLLFAFKTTGSAQVLSILALVGFLIAIFAAAISSKETDRTQPSTGAPQTSAIPKSKSIAPTSWQDRAAAVGALVDPSDISRKSVNFVKIESTAIMSDQLLRSSGRQANINGTSTHEFENKKDDLKTMADCTQAEIANYWQQAVGERISAAPFYFERAAILYRKNKQYQEEIEVCEAWIAIMSDYTTQDMKQYAEVHLGTRSKAIYHRLPKARELLERSQK